MYRLYFAIAQQEWATYMIGVIATSEEDCNTMIDDFLEEVMFTPTSVEIKSSIEVVANEPSIFIKEYFAI